ncbi:NUDIX domain-containing protein [Hymenobacter monticola]|uniref:GDP-mannose pyrophosphatase n=1 Tax=Hymenobacter monticola TaxID=1705399 RepID=A0ABY4B4E5_9BACT|nr:NUDIX hydrolase [Hymenobacter monticola]UOE34013.1 NUDIX hydrolase [Hymenobacter monticola]
MSLSPALVVDENHNPWQTLSSEVKYHNPWISVREDQVLNPSGGRGIYGVVSMKNKAIGIIPLDAEGNTWLVGQYRYALNEYSWEIPMGGGPVERDVLESAQRELKEETGLLARRWTRIARIHTSNSVTDEEGFVFLAEDLTQGDVEPEETEDLRLWKLPLAEAVRMCMDDRITDGISVAGLLKAERVLAARLAK